MGKLYELSCQKDEDSVFVPLLYSHEIKKLKSPVVIPGNSWESSNISVGYVAKTQGDLFPVYSINEVNFII